MSERTPTRTRGRTGRRERNLAPWFWGGGALALVALVVVVVVLTRGNTIDPEDIGDIPGLITEPNVSRNHVETTVAYTITPPLGGDHNPRWQNCGIYERQIQSEAAVHSLEHGAVWITYSPDLPADQVEKLRSLVRGHRFALLSPFSGLPSPVVASAWGLQIKADTADDPRIQQFLVKYEQGPQTPEPGASCSGGVGLPVER